MSIKRNTKNKINIKFGADGFQFTDDRTKLLAVRRTLVHTCDL